LTRAGVLTLGLQYHPRRADAGLINTPLVSGAADARSLVVQPWDLSNLNRSDITTVAKFLLDRLTEIGIERLVGMLGDYILDVLGDEPAHRELNWVGTTNELNAAYAGDGYARYRGAVALLATSGVSELSAVNGLVRSSAEYVPVLQIVGDPSRRSHGRYEILHHTLGDGVFSHFLRMHDSTPGRASGPHARKSCNGYQSRLDSDASALAAGLSCVSHRCCPRPQS
jgi:Thiamine pyrophosphate enzyme, N-terminal TPP binding domain